MEYLEDNEIDLVSKAKGILKLSDVFVYPVLKGESISNKKNKALYKNKEDIIQIIKKQEIYHDFWGKGVWKDSFIKAVI